MASEVIARAQAQAPWLLHVATLGVLQIGVQLQSIGKLDCRTDAKLRSRAGQVVGKPIAVDLYLIVFGKLVGQGCLGVVVEAASAVYLVG